MSQREKRYKDIKDKALRLVKLAHELEIPIIISVRDPENKINLVDASGDPEGLVKLLINSVHHIGKQLPVELADDLVLGLASMAGAK